MSLVVVLHDAGVVEVQVAQVAVGGNSAAVIAVVTSQVADGPQVEVVQRTVYYQRVVLGIVAMNVARLIVGGTA